MTDESENQSRCDPDEYRDFPHTRFVCTICEEKRVAAGWEVESIYCEDCDMFMVWDAYLWDPREDAWGNDDE